MESAALGDASPRLVVLRTLLSTNKDVAAEALQMEDAQHRTPLALSSGICRKVLVVN
jgi:hypothetical protein